MIRLLIIAALTSSAVAQDRLFDIEVSAPKSSPGDYVLCPSRQFYDNAIEKGADKTTFIYYAATLKEIGSSTCKVRSLAGTEYDIPHEFVVPLAPRQTAKVGDILLTWWQTGSGMQRAIVVGGTETEPVVRYLDITYDNPSGAGKREDTLKPNTFVKLTKPFQLGTSVSVNVNRQQRVGQLVAITDDKVLVKEFAGKLKLYPRRDATPIPIRPELKDGQAAQAQLFGSLKPITVTKVDNKIGRIFATYQLGRTEKEKVFSFGEVVPEE